MPASPPTSRRRPHPLLPALVLVAAPVVAQDPAPESAPASAPGSAEPAEPPPTVAGQTVVTATRAPRDEATVPSSAHVLDEDELREHAYRTLPQALRDLPGVMVQETAHGQGSPFIRGFTGFRNLLLIDGIRLNNSVFRDGPNQYWNTLDPLSVERLEVIKGPGSVLWGSDAIGGTVNAITRRPWTWRAQNGGSLYFRRASAEDSWIARMEASATFGEEIGVLVGGSFKDFGDLEGGSGTGLQPETGYEEIDADGKLVRRFGDDHKLILGYQLVRQDDVPRTHRTVFAVPFEGTTAGSDLRRVLTQERQLAYVQWHSDDAGPLGDELQVSLSYHSQNENRDRVRGNGNQESQGFDVDTLGLFAHASIETSIGRVTYGFDAYHDDVFSFSSTNPIQGPVGDDATYDLLGAFVQDEVEASERLDLVLGARFDYAAAEANSVSDPVTSNRISIEDDWSSVVGSARFRYALTEEEDVSLFGGVAQGFRAPNLSDLTRFDTARTNEFEIPSPGLDPEHYLSYELGVRRDCDRGELKAAVFYTRIEDLIVRFPTGNVNASGDAEITKANAGDGYVTGVELAGSAPVSPRWSVFGNATWLRGRVDTFVAPGVMREEYISRLMPLTGQLGMRWDSPDERSWAEVAVVAADDADRLSSRDASDTSRIPPGGTPGYVVLTSRVGRHLSENATIDLALENVSDEDYRVHGSGQNMPGINLIVGLKIRF